MKHSRILSLVLVLAMVLSFASFAGAEEERQKVSIALALNTNVVDYETNAYTLALEEQFNIDLELLLLEDITQKLPILVSSGSELPDMICATLDNNVVWKWAQQGVLVPLTEYWENPELTKELYTYVEEMKCDTKLIDQMLADVTMPDGNIYTLPAYDENFWNLSIHRMRVNTEWLEQAGMEIPATLDEFKDMLIYFRDNDMNGNGDPSDEIPLTGRNHIYDNPVYYLMNAFIHANPRSNYINVENGVVVPAYTQDAFKDALEYIHEMYDEGLIDPLCFTQDTTQLKATINTDVFTVGAYSALSDSTVTTEAAKAAYAIIGPVEGPDGVCMAPTIPASTTGKVYVTRYAEDPELCFRIAEIHYSREWRHIFRLGVKGVNWTDDPELIRQYKLNFVGGDYDLVSYVSIDDVWGKVQNVIWNDESMPYFSPMAGIVNQVTGKLVADLTEEELNAVSNTERHYNLYYEYQPEEMLGTLIYSNEEMEELASIQTAIDSYVQEMVMAFIVGNESLDNWDGFQKELLNMGLEKYIEIMQTAYDRKVG